MGELANWTVRQKSLLQMIYLFIRLFGWLFARCFDSLLSISITSFRWMLYFDEITIAMNTPKQSVCVDDKNK